MKKPLLFVVLVLIAVSGLGAQDQFDLSVSPRFWGATLFGKYSLTPPAVDAVETSIIAGLSGAYESVGYYRSPDGSLFMAGDGGFSAEQSSYNRFDLYWQAGIQQGILSRLDDPDDLAVVFFYYRGRYDLPFNDDSLYFSSGLPEIDGGLLGSIHAGLAFSTVSDTESTATRRGNTAEFVLQWGPSFLHNSVVGSADFTRLTLSARSYWPILERVNATGFNKFSLYSATFAAVDWATGPDIPMAVRSSIGTRSERPGTGGSVRGYESGRFDATFKAVANTEIRANLPAIVISRNLPVIVPGVLVYSDAAYYNDADMVSPVAGEQSGTLVSSGIGVYFDVRGIAQLIFYTNFLVGPPAIDGKAWVPFSLGFGFHY